MTTETPTTPLVNHLIELRERLLRVLWVMLVALLLLIPFAKDLYSWLAGPLQALLPTSMIATEVTSPFMAPLKLTLFAAFCLTIPHTLYQLWRFVAPGLYDNEKRLILPLICISVCLFILGILFAQYVVFPLIFEFFTQAAPDEIAVMTDINSYLSFVLKLFFAFGIAFQIPVAIFVLLRSGVTDYETLAGKRRWVLVACFALGMVLTPPDVLSQTLLAIPMWLLFELGLAFGKHLPKQSTEEEDANP